jgi:hypothetical protein
MPREPLNARKLLAMRLLIAGKSPTEISIETGFTPSYISSLLNQPAFRERYERIQLQLENALISEMVTKTLGEDPVEAYMRQQGLKSAEKIANLRDFSSKEEIQLRASQDILDRLGYNGKQKLEVDHKLTLSAGAEEALAKALASLELLQPVTGKEFVIHGELDADSEPGQAEGTSSE